MTFSSRWKDLSVRNKWRILFGSLLTLLLLVYELNIKKTASIVSEYNKLQNVSDTIPKGFSSGQNETPAAAAHSLPDSNKSFQNVLKYISVACEEKNIDIKEISQTYGQTSDSFKIETNRIILEGTYANMLSLIFDIEREKKIATINAANWELTKDRLSGKLVLSSIIYIKQIFYENAK